MSEYTDRNESQAVPSAQDLAFDCDRAFFDANPDVDVRRRPFIPGEFEPFRPVAPAGYRVEMVVSVVARVNGAAVIRQRRPIVVPAGEALQ